MSTTTASGRVYQSFKEGKYVLPTDRREQDRLDSQSAVFDLTLHGRLHIAPLAVPASPPPTPFTVLDIGTGTGIWAFDFSAANPFASVIGVDIKLPETQRRVPNVSFEIGNLEQAWRWRDEVDFIHGRMLTACFRDVRDVFRHALAALRPGGYLEMQDLALPFKSETGTLDGTALIEWQEALTEGGKAVGRVFATEPPNYAGYLRELGFDDVTVEVKRWPVGPWVQGDDAEAERMREIGRRAKANVLSGLEGFGGIVLKQGLGWSDERIRDLEQRAVEAINDPNIQTYFDIYFVYARKPL